MMVLPETSEGTPESDWNRIRANAMERFVDEMLNDFALIAEVLGIEGEYHVSFDVDAILEAIMRLKQNE